MWSPGYGRFEHSRHIPRIPSTAGNAGGFLHFAQDRGKYGAAAPPATGQSGPRRFTPAYALVVGLVFTLTACQPPPDAAGARETIFQGMAIGTQYNVKIVTDEPLLDGDRSEALSEIENRLGLVNRKMSTYQPDSELSRFNEHDSDAPFEISPETLRVFRKSLEVSERSGGAFDITVGPLVNLWGFGPGRQDAEPPPPEEEIETLLERVGYQHIEIDEEMGAIRKAIPELYCDLGGVAKGFAADYVAEGLEELGYDRFMVEIGGDVTARGTNQAGVPWRLAVEKPDPGARAPYAVVNLEDAALCTSGDYRNFFEHEGVTYSHTIDPSTGWPVSHNLVSVTVLHESCTLADAWATALMVLGPGEAVRVAEEEGLATLLIVREEDGALQDIVTGAMERYLERI